MLKIWFWVLALLIFGTFCGAFSKKLLVKGNKKTGPFRSRFSLYSAYDILDVIVQEEFVRMRTASDS